MKHYRTIVAEAGFHRAKVVARAKEPYHYNHNQADGRSWKAHRKTQYKVM